MNGKTPFFVGLATPLNLAALITWLAVLVQSVDMAALGDGSLRQMGGVASLLLFALAFVASTRYVQSTRIALVVVQGLLVLVATSFQRNGGAAILLIIVASQAVALLDRRNALLLMAAMNLALGAIWATALPLTQVLLFLTPVIGFQLFAALTMHYAVSAEAARLALMHTHAQLLATQQLLAESARGDERLKLSRELHDVAGHKLTALKLNLRLLQRRAELANDPELALVSQLADELLADIRAVVGELRRHDGIDLPSAIALLTAQLPGPTFEVSIEPSLRIADVARAEALLRCVQEGITNALKHGKPGRIRIALQQIGDRLALTIEDDGRARGEIRFGNGLTGMRERLAALGGLLRVATTADGVCLRAEVPA